MYKLIVSGVIGKKPEVKITSSGKEMVTFSLAVKKNKEQTDWLDIVCFDKTAEYVKSYADKGSRILMEGSPQANAYIKNNEAIAKLSCIAHTVEFTSSKSEPTKTSPLTADECPF